MKLLNIGGRDHETLIPSEYDGWHNIILDLNPKADLCMSALNVENLERESFDAVFCSHTLEHIERWDLPRVIAGVDKVLKPFGWFHIIVPDIGFVAKRLARSQDPDEQIYLSPAGPITIADLLYGYQLDIRESEPFRHVNGFTEISLRRSLRPYFKHFEIGHNIETCELHMKAWKHEPAA